MVKIIQKDPVNCLHTHYANAPLGAFSDIFSIQIAGAVTAAAATLVTIYCLPESALDGLQLTLPFCICTWVLLTR